MSVHWTELGLRGFPPLSARTKVTEFSPVMAAMVAAAQQGLAEPFQGITSDGNLITNPGLLQATGAPTGPILDAALSFLDSLDGAQRARVGFDLDSDERRLWLNVHPNIMRHGLLLEDLAVHQRNAAMGLMRSCLSERGYLQARDIMAVNGLLVEITGSSDQFGEWPYWISIFGNPGPDQPWGWQIDGHHLNLNFFVVGDRLVFTPSFMGSEPCRVTGGPLAGVDLFVAEQRVGLDFMRALTDDQLGVAITAGSILPADLAPELRHPIDGRMQAGAFKDNAIIPYEGLCADRLSDVQRALLRRLIATYVGWGADGHATVTMAEVDAHLDQTWFSWMGSVADNGPFYYRAHSPVALIEFDHHPGVVFDNLEPSHHHIHTILRTPNGGDYGIDQLRAHHARFDHSQGQHHPRP